VSNPGFTPLAARPSPYPAVDVDASAATTSRVDLREAVDPNVFVNAYTRPLPTYAETFAGPGYQTRPLPTSGAAVAALVCGIVGVILWVPALAAIVLGHIGLVSTGRNTRAGRGLAIGGLVLGYAVVGMVSLVLLAFWIADS
jgi:hypothetical protein